MDARLRSGVPAVSVVVPTYERRELVRRAVKSVLAQTLGDLEVIVVDDGSTDGTEEAVRGLDERVTYVHQDQRGAAAAHNVGIELGSAPVIAFLDSDELWLPHHLTVVMSALARHPEAVLAAARPQAQVAGRRLGPEPILLDLLPRLLIENPVGATSCVAVRREALAAVGKFDERLTVGSDVDLWLRLALLGPFSIVRARTRLRQKRTDSLQAWGLRHHAYLEARELMLARTIEQLESRSGAHGQLAATARGMHQLCVALRCFRLRRESEAAAALREACAFVPALSSEYAAVVDHVRMAAPLGPESAELCARIAGLWPDPGATTANVLRAWGALIALRAGHLRTAKTLLADRRLARSAPRTAAAIALLLERRVARELRHRLDHVHIAARGLPR